MALLFPEIHARVDWSKTYRSPDKELQKILPDAESGRLQADKLIEVCPLKDPRFANVGSAKDRLWILVHIEIQGEPELAFAARMFQYHVRIRERYNQSVVSLAVLTDARPSFRPDHYADGFWGCNIDFRFPMVKLLDWRKPGRWAELEQSENVFALVVMAQILAKTVKDAPTLKDWKFRLFRLMYDRGYTRQTIIDLLKTIDWMIQLPPGLEAEVVGEIHRYEEAKKVAYVTSFERIATEKGQKLGEAKVLLRQFERRFGPPTDEVQARVMAADSELLLRWSDRILDAKSPEELFH